MTDVFFVSLKMFWKLHLDSEGHGTCSITETLDGWTHSERIGEELGDPSAYYAPRQIQLGVRVDL